MASYAEKLRKRFAIRALRNNKAVVEQALHEVQDKLDEVNTDLATPEADRDTNLTDGQLVAKKAGLEEHAAELAQELASVNAQIVAARTA